MLDSRVPVVVALLFLKCLAILVVQTQGKPVQIALDRRFLEPTQFNNMLQSFKLASTHRCIYCETVTDWCRFLSAGLAAFGSWSDLLSSSS